MRTKSLAFLAGIIWLAAGFNVCRIGVESWMSTDATTVVMILGCIATMVVFSRMFVRMLFQNVQRIREIELEKRKLWDIMPVKSYLIMIFMITFGVLQRRCPAVPAPSSPLSTWAWALRWRWQARFTSLPASVQRNCNIIAI
ncbi:MAG: hypothetical protein PUJ28_07230 [Prevotellaceae bacterium]|nr:hypothetical protein [Prevotellaceae bacterium]